MLKKPKNHSENTQDNTKNVVGCLNNDSAGSSPTRGMELEAILCCSVKQFQENIRLVAPL
jgi:hypothetical protein